MPHEVIRVDTVNDAVYAILHKLESNHKARVRNVIYFGGWDGLGASSVLRAIPTVLASKKYQRLRPGAADFERVIHIDFSHWESARAVQRAIAEQLKLPNSVIEVIDKQDEEDDLNGVDKGSRSEIPDVVVAIHKRIQGSTFLLVLHNGSSEEINTDDLGLSLNWYMANGVVWTFDSEFRLRSGGLRIRDTTPIVLYAEGFKRDPLELRSYLLHEDATHIARKHDTDPATVVQCLLYMLERSYMSLHTIDYDWALHAGNYWICDGIVHKEKGIHQAWQLADGLHREMKSCIDYLSSYNLHRQACKSVDASNRHLSKMRWSAERRPYFISREACEFLPNLAGIVSNSMFQHSEKLTVLKLSRCTFRFTSPPFLYCHTLRFLCLDNCQDLVSSTNVEEEKDITRSWPCFLNLWVLDLRYTHWDEVFSPHMFDLMINLRELNVTGAQHWDMSHLHGRLSNIHKLRVTKSTCCSNSEEIGGHNLFFKMEKMELFEFLENHTTQGMKSLSGAARSSSLKTITVGGCVGLENISLRGCKELENLYFRGLLCSLTELDLSNTTIKILDLRKLEATHLKRLILLGCEKLCAILWPLKDETPQNFEVLHINTTRSAACGQAILEEEKASASTRSSSAAITESSTGQSTSFQHTNWSITVRDQMLLQSFVPVGDYLKQKYVHIEMDSYPTSDVGGGGSEGAQRFRGLKQSDNCLYGKDVIFQAHLQVATNEDVISMWTFPPIPALNAEDCYLHIQDEVEMKSGQQQSSSTDTSTNAALTPAFICNIAKILHVHNSLSVTGLQFQLGSNWDRLERCQVESCPNLRIVFPPPQECDGNKDIFYHLGTFWASQLPEVQHIWSWSPQSQPSKDSFHWLKLLHLDRCPRLVYVLPFSTLMVTLPYLETLEIMCCADLKEVFPLSAKHPEKHSVIEFPRLRTIHLYELPTMQRICGRMLFAPRLETIKIRGCWNIRHMPIRGGNIKPNVDCEKEWWDGLDWDGLEEKHHPSLYRLCNSPYYKNYQLPRSTVLR